MAARDSAVGAGAVTDAVLDWVETPAQREVVAAITERAGPIRFSEFMRIALYGRHGYYTTARDRRTDYLTSPQTHREFGACVARCLQRMWQTMGAPARWTVVELGAGDGALQREVLRGVRDDDGGAASGDDRSFEDALEYRAYDIGADAKGASSGVEPVAMLEDSAASAACVLSNELLDAFPADQFVVRGGELRELRVDVSETGRLTEVEDDGVSDEVAGLLGDWFVDYPDGYVGEVAIGVEDWVADVSLLVETGYVLTIDYGHVRDALYAPERLGGTLRSHRGHVLGSDPFRAVGEQDLTTHVDFTRLVSALEAHGFEVAAPLMTQAEFLGRHGYDDALLAARRRLAAARSSEDVASAEADLRARRELADPRSLGGFKVAIYRRGVPALEASS